jgi:hypothetical protein
MSLLIFFLYLLETIIDLIKQTLIQIWTIKKRNELAFVFIAFTLTLVKHIDFKKLNAENRTLTYSLYFVFIISILLNDKKT